MPNTPAFGSGRRVALVLAAAGLALCAVGCTGMSPKVYRDDMPLVAGGEVTPASPDWVNDLARKPWAAGPAPKWDDGKGAPTTAYSEDQGYMILLRKPKVSTQKHDTDLTSDWLWSLKKKGR